MNWNYQPATRFTLSGSKPMDWITGLVVWLLNWANQNFALLATLAAGVLITKVFRIKLNVGK